MTYYIPQEHICKNGHKFQYSQSWDGYLLDQNNDPYCPTCLKVFLSEHVPIGINQVFGQKKGDKE